MPSSVGLVFGAILSRAIIIATPCLALFEDAVLHLMTSREALQLHQRLKFNQTISMLLDNCNEGWSCRCGGELGHDAVRENALVCEYVYYAVLRHYHCHHALHQYQNCFIIIIVSVTAFISHR